MEQSAPRNQLDPKQDDDTQFKSTNAKEMNTTSKTLGDKVDNMKILYSEQTSSPKQKDVQGTDVKDEDENRCKGNFRPIIIDGCNIAFQLGSNGKTKKFSAKGLKIAYEYFKAKGYADKDIIIVIKHVPKITKEDVEILDDLKELGVITETPSRLAGNERFQSDDDLLILSIAKDIGGVVVTKDQYRDHFKESPEYKDVIRNRLIQPIFFGGDRFKLPVVPLGKKGPSLDEFLRF